MANKFLTLQEIARQALPILQENLVFPELINKNYSDTFAKKGDTIQVERPAVYVADEFSGTINLQEINPHPVLVKLDKIADVSVSVTAKQMALNVDDFSRLVLRPALVAIGEKINNDGLELYKYVNSFEGASGTTPDGLDDFANARKRLNVNKVPTVQRRAVWDPDADAKLSILDAIVNAEKSGSTQALREGAIGRIQGMENYMAQAVKTHTAGAYTALDDVTASADVSAVNAVNATTGLKYTSATLTSAAGASTAKLLKGDVMTIDGKQYVVLEDTASAIAGVVTTKLYPQMSADITVEAVTFPDVTAGGHVANLAFHESAFGFVTRPLEPTPGAQSYTVNYNGLTIRVTMDYDISTKTTIMSIDTLYGYAPLYPELATRVLG